MNMQSTISGAGHVFQHVPDSSPRHADRSRDDMASDQPTKLCECGCGLPAGKRFAGRGHEARTRPRKYSDPVDRILARCVWDGGCLIWQGAKTSNGYGNIWAYGRHVAVHRIMYEHAHGPIPEGLVIDHVKALGCHSTSCCNQAHLQAVTQRENLLRGDTSNATNVLKTHCRFGHELSGTNLLPAQLRQGKRACRLCENARQRARHRKLSR